MEQARHAYLQALQGGTKLGEALDQFCDTLEEKQAEAEYFSPDSAGHGMGILASLLGLGAVGTGMWAYDATKKQLPSNMLEEAKQREARNRMIARPSPVYARLAPTGSSLLTRP